MDRNAPLDFRLQSSGFRQSLLLSGLEEQDRGSELVLTEESEPFVDERLVSWVFSDHDPAIDSPQVSWNREPERDQHQACENPADCREGPHHPRILSGS